MAKSESVKIEVEDSTARIEFAKQRYGTDPSIEVRFQVKADYERINVIGRCYLYKSRSGVPTFSDPTWYLDDMATFGQARAFVKFMTKQQAGLTKLNDQAGYATTIHDHLLRAFNVAGIKRIRIFKTDYLKLPDWLGSTYLEYWDCDPSQALYRLQDSIDTFLKPESIEVLQLTEG